MKTMNRTKWIGVGVGLAMVAYFLYGASFMNLFNSPTNNSANTTMAIPTTGVKTTDEVIGQGAAAAPGDIVTVHYVGTLESGKVFDSSLDRGQPFSFTLGAGQVIKGWDEGVVGMQVGGKRQLVIAPDFAYGDRAVGTIPANSALIFEVQLLNVQKPSVVSQTVNIAPKQ